MKTKIFQFINNYYLYIVLFLSFTATAGSLFITELLTLTPCDLCWYQRIFMYSTFAIALIGTIIKDEADTYKYLLGLALPGFLIAIYHYFIQKLPNNPYVYGCSIGNPCTRIDFELFGFITIPLMSAVCFALILILIVIKLKVDRES